MKKENLLINDIAIEELTKLLIKEDFENKGKEQEVFKLTRQDLLKFSIKLIKTIERCKNEF